MQVFLSFVYICIGVGDPVIKRGSWDPFKRFNPATFLCLSKTRIWIFNVIYVVIFPVFSELR